MKQPIIRRLGLALACLIVVLLVPTLTAAQGDFPPIPHPLEGRAECLTCHETGTSGSQQIPDDHSGRTDDMCQVCHQPAPATEVPLESDTATPEATSTTPPEASPTEVGPLQVPHTLEGRENCLECHVSPEATLVLEGGPLAIPHPLIGRENCLTCHQAGVGTAPLVPDDHAGRTDDICQACHQPSQLPAPPTPTAPAEPIPTPIAYPRVEGVNTCLDCHSTLEGADADIVAQWQISIHAERDGATCADCHGGDPSAGTIDGAMSPGAGYIGVPAKADIPALCASCHADVVRMRQYDLPTDQYAKYKESIHGIRLTEGDLNVTTCFDCHGGHQVLRASDPASTVYPPNVPDTCAACHADEGLMAPYDIPTDQDELYRHSVHGQALLDAQNFRAPNCATCHGTHGAAPPGFEEVAGVCGSCHSATQDYYLQSHHASAGDGAPRCFTCHGHHDASKPTEALFLGTEPRHCGSCHAADSEGGQSAESLYDTIDTAARAHDDAEVAIQSARAVGMLVAPEERRLRDAGTSLITARAAQHSLDTPLVRERADDGRVIADEVKASADAAVSKSVFRRQAMAVAVVIMGLAIVPLYLLKRELDRQLEADS